MLNVQCGSWCAIDASPQPRANGKIGVFEHYESEQIERDAHTQEAIAASPYAYA